MNAYSDSDVDLKIFGYFEPKILGMALMERINKLELKSEISSSYLTKYEFTSLNKSHPSLSQ
jgi:hypothetical protein